MVHEIPFTDYAKYLAQAKAIQHSLEKGTRPATVRQAVGDLADLAVKVLAETNEAFEGLAAFIMALHPEVKRTPPAIQATSEARP